jgi:1-acyl-sn-glycerol-3-phosphate acyltransferase
MQETPGKLKRLYRPRLFRRAVGAAEMMEGWPLTAREQRRVVRKLRAVRRLLMVLAWTIIACPIQAVLLALPGRPKVDFARFYWRAVSWLLGMRVRQIGASAATIAAPGGRPVIFVSNHSSWLDIPVLGGRLPACFVSKDEVGRWPVIRLVARLGRTVYVTRKRGSIADERDSMRGRLAGGDNLLLFPEGTSSDGSRVLPFRSAFFVIAEPADGVRPLLQPVSVVYDRMGWLTTGRASRSVFAWYGDMNLAQHFWRLAQLRGMRATVLLHAPVDPAAYPNRKALAQAVWQAVADGAATLRQNRPARPLVAAEAASGLWPGLTEGLGGGVASGLDGDTLLA